MNNTAWGIPIGITVALILLLVVLPLVAMAMMGMGGTMGFGGAGGMMGQTGSILWPAWLTLVIGLLIVGGLILLVVWGARRLRQSDGPTANETPLAIIQERFARGEIGREEYEGAREILLRDGDNR